MYRTYNFSTFSLYFGPGRELFQVYFHSIFLRQHPIINKVMQASSLLTGCRVPSAQYTWHSWIYFTLGVNGQSDQFPHLHKEPKLGSRIYRFFSVPDLSKVIQTRPCCRQHCRLSICFFLDTESETNPNDNLMMKRAGLSTLLAHMK